MKLENKVAIVTGGSRGIGYAIARQLGLDGYNVVVVATGPQEKNQAALDALTQEGITWAYVQANIGDHDDRLRIVAEALEAFGRIDALVNNAGVSESTPFTSYTEDAFDKVMDLNVKGVYNATRAACECMIARGNGVILNTSSMVSIYGQPSGIAYPASKFAVNGLTVSLARELGPKGIRVNAVAPGITETDMMKAVPKEMIEPLISQIPLRRLGQPEDIANAFVFLASEEASYITGVVLSVDGMART